MRKITLFLALLAIATALDAQLIVNTSASAYVMATNIFGPGATVSNVVLTSAPTASGTFANGTTTSLGLDSGTVLTSGNANNINNAAFIWTGQCNSSVSSGNPLLDLITGQSTYDACILEFDVIPVCSTLATTFVFGSEEYPEWVGSFNDGFGIFVSGPNPSGGNYNNFNIAVVPGTITPVTISTVNAVTNSAYYIDNSASITIVYDGITVPITAQVPVVPCSTYHVTIVVGDGNDCAYDTGVLLHYRNNASCSPPLLTISPDAMICPGGFTTLSVGPGADHYVWSPQTGLNTTTGLTVLASPQVTTTYTVFAYMGCNLASGVSTTVTVTVVPKPDVFITPLYPVIECIGSVVLTANGAASYVWTPSGDTASSIIVSPNQTTIYTVTGTTGDTLLPCTATTTVTVEVADSMYVPSAFTPNNNGTNEIFIPVSVLTHGHCDVEQYEFMIFDRWGTMIFTTNDLTVGWDGTVGNAKNSAPQGIYSWMITYKIKGHYDKTMVGRVTLIR